METENLFCEIDKTSQYTITVPSSLISKLDDHLQILKFLHHPENKRQTWIINAIRKKLSLANNLNIAKGKHLNLKLEELLANELEGRLAEILKLHPNYTKKQWILEAIEEKLESEKELVQNKLTEIREGIKK